MLEAFQPSLTLTYEQLPLFMKRLQLLSMLVPSVEMLLPCKCFCSMHFIPPCIALCSLPKAPHITQSSCSSPNCIDYALVFHACALSGIVVSPVAPNFQTAELKQQLQVVITANVQLLHLRMLLFESPFPTLILPCSPAVPSSFGRCPTCCQSHVRDLTQGLVTVGCGNVSVHQLTACKCNR